MNALLHQRLSKSLGIVALSLLINLGWSLPSMAEQGPMLKVLLFSGKGVHIQDSKGLQLRGLKLDNLRKLTISRHDSKTLKLNNRWLIESSLRIYPSSILKVRRTGRRAFRRYAGMIEVKPYRGGVRVINHLPVETYLEGVLNAEISTKWPMEVIKAQSVLARTYALQKLRSRAGRDWHIQASFKDQSYKGLNIADARGRAAIDSTRGLVVTYRGALAWTFYHSNCGGMTEDPGNLWQNSYPYYRIRKVPFGQNAPNYNWEVMVTDRQLQKAMAKAGLKRDSVKTLTVIERTASERASVLALYGRRNQRIKASDLRRLVGYTRIKSLMFEVVRMPGGFYFKGRGSGHGVGMCQWAAKEMAERGYSYMQILRYFYDPVDIRRYRS